MKTPRDRINSEKVLSGAFDVTYKQAAITSEDVSKNSHPVERNLQAEYQSQVNAIVFMALKAAGIDSKYYS